jgi:NAD(P)-dependent dehydrogenase (short-subunit alcohol dehydrogenase family)
MRVVLVTGGGSGIGRACALALAKAGFTTVVTGRRPDALEATVARIVAAGGAALAVPADITNPESVQTLFAAVKQRRSKT